ncbi:MAG TPA: DCC1-like thiol-disulfide oxidoreductase family protein [Thermoanaerobaculia bacterium]|jgi:predicted DCC family thiol-disulfide oxidoreductase YuxK|nr:DCC1-like thiol-disulfide oxidoreductase family protein [Thermoanaerobaculia bacterium]
MKTGWTGGQYSIVRAIFGAYLFIHFVALIPHAHEVFEQILPRDASPLLRLFPNILAFADVAMPLVVIAAIASIFFAIGLYDRIAAVLIWYVLACLFGRNPLIANPSLPYAGWLLLAHAFVPPAPFGSWKARGRTDPRGNWSMPPALYAAMWIVMSLGYSFSGWTKLASPSWVDGSAMVRVLANPLARPSFVQELMLALPPQLLQLMTWSSLGLELLCAPLALFRRVRPWIWLATLGMHLGLLVLIDFADLSFMMIILHLFTFDPEWVPRRAPATTDTLLYDGSCGLCHRSVRLILAEDRSGTAFRFEPLPEGGEKSSMIVQTADGRTLTRSDAVKHVTHRLGGLWRVYAIVFGAVPRVIRDAMYDFVARIRYRIFGRTKEACPLIPPDLRSRFNA